MTISGVRVDLLAEPELDRRDPERARLRMADSFAPECVRSVIRRLGEVRSGFSGPLRSAPLESLTPRPAPGR